MQPNPVSIPSWPSHQPYGEDVTQGHKTGVTMRYLGGYITEIIETELTR